MAKKRLPLAQYPRQTLSVGHLIITYGLATVIVIMTTAQLITYERFVPLLENYQFGVTATTKSFAAILVISAVVALPFLLRMSLSPLFRFLSTLSLLLYSSMWLFLGLWATSHQPPTIGSGLLGGIGSNYLSSDITLVVALLLAGWVATALWILRRDIKP